MLLTVNDYTLRSFNTGMCEDLLADAGYDPAEHAGLVEEMAFAVDLAAVDTAYEVMREHGLKTLADRARITAALTREQPSEDENHG